MLHLGRVKATDAGTEKNSDLCSVQFTEFEAGILQGTPSRVNAKVGKTIRAPNFFGGWERGSRVERFHLGRDLAVVRGAVEGGDTVNTTVTGNHVLPERRGIEPEARGAADAGDDDPAVRPIASHS